MNIANGGFMRSFLFSKNILYLIFIFVFLIGGCSGAIEEGDSADSSSTSRITYKLGTSADGYTALSLTSSNGEALIAIAASPGSNDVRYVIVRASNGESALLAFLYGNNFPDVMISGDHSWVFKNYNGSTADITYVAPDGTRTTTTGVSVARSTGVQRAGATSGNPDLFRGEISDTVWNVITSVRFATCAALVLTPGAAAVFCGVTVYDVAAKTEGLPPSLMGKLTNFLGDSAECNYEQWVGNTGYYQCMDEIRGQTNAAPIDTDGNSTDSGGGDTGGGTTDNSCLTGSWTGTVTCPGGSAPLTINMTQNGSQVSLNSSIDGQYSGTWDGSTLSASFQDNTTCNSTTDETWTITGCSSASLSSTTDTTCSGVFLGTTSCSGSLAKQ
ncbi:hypothetical protein MNBD_NITROSPINAE02-1100 [hydrothermal vent metagenome]|uniref:Uncharacterized protein n=1 Tax=hydrothermal vent metagenome TaxID=652676 RepID=A0A3B1BRK8_9ZZZZ